MSVQEITADVVMKPTAVTVWAALVVPVSQDTPEMDSPVPVSLLKQAGMLT